MKEGLGHIIDLTPIGEKRKESLKRLTLTSGTLVLYYQDRTMIKTDTNSLLLIKLRHRIDILVTK